jgi:hypothetical protein
MGWDVIWLKSEKPGQSRKTGMHIAWLYRQNKQEPPRETTQ